MNSKERVLYEVRKIIANGYDKFVIFPYGEYGKITKEILREYFNIEVLAVFDNKVVAEGVKTLSYLRENPLSDDVYLIITSSSLKYYNELREEAVKYVKKEKIIDMFQRTNPLEDEYLEERAKALGLDFDTNIVALKSYDVKFYIPYWKKDFIQRKILLEDRYFEDEYLYFVKRHFGKKIQGGCVLDIGANIGNHTLYFAKECGAEKVYAFEPIKDTYGILEQNVKINDLKDRVVLVNKGVGVCAGKASIERYDVDNIGATSLKNDLNGEIEICSIDELAISEKISLIKIDVEGHEKEVIQGAIETIKTSLPSIMVEIWIGQESIFDIIEILSPLGYRFVQFDCSNYVFTATKEVEI